jgi:hypothetical protein
VDVTGKDDWRVAHDMRFTVKVAPHHQVQRELLEAILPVGGASHPVEDLVMPRPPRKRKSTGESTPVWEAYARAYELRYGTPPVRNATTNTALLNLIKRVGAQDAPDVARFYVEHNGAFYCQKGHAPQFMVADAEKLHTEWKTGRRITASASRMNERADANQQAIQDYLRKEEDPEGGIQL